MAVKMKNNSMNMAPNGRTPAINELKEKKKLKIVSFIFKINLPKNGVHVPHLLGYLSRDLIGADRVLIWSFAVSKIIAQKYEWERDEEPKTEQRQHGSKWYGSAAVFAPNEKIEEEAHRENDSGVKHCSLSNTKRD